MLYNAPLGDLSPLAQTRSMVMDGDPWTALQVQSPARGHLVNHRVEPTDSVDPKCAPDTNKV